MKVKKQQKNQYQSQYQNQYQTASAGIIELTDNELEHITGGTGEGHWVGVSDSNGNRQVWVQVNPTS